MLERPVTSLHHTTCGLKTLTRMNYPASLGTERVFTTEKLTAKASTTIVAPALLVLKEDPRACWAAAPVVARSVLAPVDLKEPLLLDVHFLRHYHFLKSSLLAGFRPFQVVRSSQCFLLPPERVAEHPRLPDPRRPERQ